MQTQLKDLSLSLNTLHIVTTIHWFSSHLAERITQEIRIFIIKNNLGRKGPFRKTRMGAG